jgi:dienelactone hydrolase
MTSSASGKSCRRRNSLLLAIAFFASALGQTGCLSTGKPGTKATTPHLPKESSFVRNEIAIPGTERSYPMWRTRSGGRPVLLLHPINGLSGDFLRFALELETWGYRVYFPSLYGDPIKGEPAFGYDRELGSIKLLRESGTWNPVSPESTGPIVDDVRAIARWVSRREGGRDLVVVGNSLTGTFPLALLDEACVKTAVLGQPALPAMRVPQVMMRIPQSMEKKRALTLTETQWDAITASLRRHPDKRIIGFHYLEDPIAPIERFDSLHERLGAEGLTDRFKAYVLSPGGEAYAAERRTWVVGSDTVERRKMVTPHSTYLDAENQADREWFRDRLRKALAMAR